MYQYMTNVQKVLIFTLFSVLIAQSSSSTKKRKVYRTQAGSIIEAPTPIFNRVVKKKTKKTKKENIKSTSPIRTKKIETTYRNDLDSLKSTVSMLLKQSKILKENYEDRISERLTDTIFVYTTLYDTTTVLDTTFIYTNATTTVYDTTVIIDSIYVNSYDTTTIVQANYDTVYVMDTTVVVNYDTTIMKDTIWAFAYDTTSIYDTTWVFAHDTTVIRDSIWLFAVDSVRTFDTLVVSNNDTVTIHTYSSKFPNNFTPDMIRENQSAFPKYKTLGDALRARDTGDKSAQGWINQALNAAGGDWTKAEDEYKQLQKIYSTAMVKAITRQPKDNAFIGPDLKYRSVIFDTLKILTFDTTLIQDTVKNLVKQTYVKYDTSIVNNRREVIANTTPPGHELIIKYHRNGRVKEKGLMKGSKKNGEWMQYDFKGIPLRKSVYEMGRIVEDELVVNNESDKPDKSIDIFSRSSKKEKTKEKSEETKTNRFFKLPKFGKK